MGKVRLALNYALMLEMMKANGLSNETICTLLDEGNEEKFENFGEAIPTWKTMIDFYHLNQGLCDQALKGGYEISFLTKGALKSLLSIKFGMKEGIDFVDTGSYLDHVKITTENLQILREVISQNWTIFLLEETADKNILMVKIELTHQPISI